MTRTSLLNPRSQCIISNGAITLALDALLNTGRPDLPTVLTAAKDYFEEIRQKMTSARLDERKDLKFAPEYVDKISTRHFGKQE